MDYQKLALDYIGASQKELLKFTLTADSVRVVLDHGIKGCPSHVIPLEDLQPTGVDVVELAADDYAAPEARDYELDATRAALQALTAAGLAGQAAQHFAGQRVTKAMAEEYIHDNR